MTAFGNGIVKRSKIIPAFALHRHHPAQQALKLGLVLVGYHLSAIIISSQFLAQIVFQNLEFTPPVMLICVDKEESSNALRKQRICFHFSGPHNKMYRSPKRDRTSRTSEGREIEKGHHDMEDETKPTMVVMEGKTLDSVMAGTAWQTSDEFAGRISANTTGCVDTMARWTREGRLFALDMGDKRVYPAYAFDAAGAPLPVIKRVLQNLSMHDAFSLACWFESPNTYLDGGRPRDMLVTDPERVVAAAEAQCHCYRRPGN